MSLICFSDEILENLEKKRVDGNLGIGALEDVSDFALITRVEEDLACTPFFVFVVVLFSELRSIETIEEIFGLE